jgi:hypothetical protein
MECVFTKGGKTQNCDGCIAAHAVCRALGEKRQKTSGSLAESADASKWRDAMLAEFQRLTQEVQGVKLAGEQLVDELEWWWEKAIVEMEDEGEMEDEVEDEEELAEEIASLSWEVKGKEKEFVEEREREVLEFPESSELGVGEE